MQPSPHKAASLGERYAVVIGINTYRDANIPPLRFAGNDAMAMRDFLIHPELGKFKKENVHLLIDAEATLGDIRSQFVYWLGPRVQNQDEVWIYFAGRGTTDRTFASAIGQAFMNYLIAHDTLRDDLPGAAISIKQLDEWLDLLGDARLVLLFDCGFSAVDQGRALASSKPPALDDFAFLPVLTQGKKRFLLAGTGPTEISLEDTDIELGLFSRILLQRLRSAVLSQGTSSITWNELYQNIAAEVAWQAETRGATQKPVKFGVLAADPIFVQRPVLTAPAFIPAREPQPEHQSEPALPPEPKPMLPPEPEPVFVVPDAAPLAIPAAAEIEALQNSFHAATAEPASAIFAPAVEEAKSDPDVVTREHIDELLHLAKEEARGGNLYRAQDALEKAIVLDPNDRRAATGLRKIEEALRQLDRAELIKTAFNAAWRYTDEKNYSEAMRYYAKVLEIDGTSESARLGIESCRELLEKQNLYRTSNGRMTLSKSVHEKPAHAHHLKSYNETIWPYVGWAALLGCIWSLFGTHMENETTSWIFWITVAWGLVGGVVGLVAGSSVYLAKHLAIHLEDRRAKRLPEEL